MLKSVLQFFGILPRKINDELLGELRISYGKFDGKDYQQLSNYNFYFTPLKKTVNFSVFTFNGILSGPQKEIYKHISNNYLAIIDQISKTIDEKYLKEKEKLGISNFREDLELIAISIDEVDQDIITWDLDFEGKANTDLFAVVFFENGEIESIDIDSF